MPRKKEPFDPIVVTPWRVTAGFALAIATLLGVCAVSLIGFYERTQRVSAAGHTVALLRTIEQVESEVDASQLAVAEFLVTGESEMLTPYERARATIPGTLERLRTMLAEHARDLDTLQQLEPLIDEALDRNARELERRRAAVPSDDLRPLLLENKSLLDRAATLLDRLSQNAGERLDENQKIIAQSMRRSALIVVVGDALLLALILVAALLSTRDAAAKARAVAFQRRILGIVGHDLRNPLSVISMAAAQLGRGIAVGDRRGTWVARVASAANRMDRLIRDLLDYSRLELGMTLPLAIREANADASCHRIVEDFRAIHPQRQIVYEPGDTADVTWDPDRMEQVLENLVTNAIKYSPETAPVCIGWVRSESEIVIQVKNRGEPIPAELLPHLFEPFQRGTHDIVISKQSLGLGLYIVRNIVKQHGGTITVDSSEISGTTFTLALPQPVPRARAAGGRE